MSPAIFDEQLPDRIEQALGQLHSPAVPVDYAHSPAVPAGSDRMDHTGRDGRAMCGTRAGKCYGAQMSPQLTYGRHRGPAPQAARRAAVLAMLVRRTSGWHIPLAVRPETLTHHRGQIGLPGGQIEAGETSEAAALREFTEELGVLPTCRLMGHLPACYVFASDFEVTPWIAATEDAPTWSRCPAEVERIVEMPLTTLLDPAAVDEMTIRRGPLTFNAPCYRIGDDHVWGATAVILSELASLVSGQWSLVSNQ